MSMAFKVEIDRGEINATISGSAADILSQWMKVTEIIYTNLGSSNPVIAAFLRKRMPSMTAFVIETCDKESGAKDGAVTVDLDALMEQLYGGGEQDGD